MNSLFGLALPQPYVYVLALAGILILLAVFAYFLRRIVQTTRGFDGSGRGRQPRLGVVDTFSVDRQRQLMIVRRDSVEHLILIGGNSDLVIETNISRATATTQRDPAISGKVTPTIGPAQLPTVEASLGSTGLPKAPHSPFSMASRQAPRPRTDESDIRPADFAEIARHFEKSAAPRDPEVTLPEVAAFPAPKTDGFAPAYGNPPPLTASHETIAIKSEDRDPLSPTAETDALSAPIIPLRDELSPTEGLRRLLGRTRDA